MSASTSLNSRTRKLSHDILQLDTLYSKDGIAVMYLMRQGDHVAIIETGTSHCVEDVVLLLQRWGLGVDAVDYVIPTHVHLDHAGGAGALMASCANAQLVIHPRGARHMIDPQKLIAGTIAVYGEEAFRTLYGEIVPVPEERVIIADDNFKIDFHGRVLTFLDTPGHARHHFCIHDAHSNGFFTGDTYGVCYPSLETDTGAFIFPTCTPVQFEPEAMKASIRRLMEYNPAIMYLTHFGAITPDAVITNDLLNYIDGFVDIALAEAKTEPSIRIKNIESRMMDYLMACISQKGRRITREDFENKLAMDVHLNAQGLDVWLSRQQSS